jgi:hypothetical protein
MTLEPSLFHACELWRRRAVAAEAVRDELLIRIRDLEQQIAELKKKK